MRIEAPALPYNFADLEPAMSRDTLVLHFLRHQRLCFDRLRALIEGTPHEALALEELVRATARVPAQRLVHRHAADLWNHGFYWQCMRPGGGGAAPAPVEALLRERFGSYGRFVDAFRARAAAHFGSGWLWLVWRAGRPEIVATRNSGCPLASGAPALLALDLWEHAYYLDHHNRRGAYVRCYLEELVDWDAVLRRLPAPAVCGRAGSAPASREAVRGCSPPARGGDGRAGPPAGRLP